MRLIDARITDHRSIHELTVPLDGLTVLTAEDPLLVADAYDALLILFTGRRDNPGNLPVGDDDGVTPHPGHIRFSLDGRQIPGSYEEALADAMLRLHYVDVFVPEVDDPLDFVFTTASREWAEGLVQNLVAWTPSGDHADKVRLARALVEETDTFLLGMTTWVQLDLETMASSAIAAARNLAAYPCARGSEDVDGQVTYSSHDEPDDYLVRVAAELMLHGSVQTMEVDIELNGSGPFGVLSFDLPIDSLIAEIRDALPDIGHDLVAGACSSGGYHDSLHLGPLPDPWLAEIEVEDDVDLMSSEPSTTPLVTAVQLDPVVIGGADYLGMHATRLAPSFIRDHGTIEISVFGPRMWQAHPDRFVIEYRRADGSVRTLDHLDPGTRRYVVAALRLALTDIQSSDTAILDDVFAAMARDAYDLAEACGIEELDLTPTLPLLAPATKRQIIFAQPEADLTPAMVASVGAWLEDLADTHLGVLVTSYSPEIAALRANVPDLTEGRVDRCDG